MSWFKAIQELKTRANPLSSDRSASLAEQVQSKTVIKQLGSQMVSQSDDKTRICQAFVPVRTSIRRCAYFRVGAFPGSVGSYKREREERLITIQRGRCLLDAGQKNRKAKQKRARAVSRAVWLPSQKSRSKSRDTPTHSFAKPPGSSQPSGLAGHYADDSLGPQMSVLRPIG